MRLADLMKSSGEDVTDWKILDKMLDKGNVPLTTEIKNPIAHTRLKAVARILESRGMNLGAEAIVAFLDDQDVHMVAKDRKRSEEIVTSFRELIAHNERMKGKGDRELSGGRF